MYKGGEGCLPTPFLSRIDIEEVKRRPLYIQIHNFPKATPIVPDIKVRVGVKLNPLPKASFNGIMQSNIGQYIHRIKKQ